MTPPSCAAALNTVALRSDPWGVEPQQVLIRFVSRPADTAGAVSALRAHIERSTGRRVRDVTGSAAHDAEGIVAWIVTVPAADRRAGVGRARELLAAAATGTGTCTMASVMGWSGD